MHRSFILPSAPGNMCYSTCSGSVPPSSPQTPVNPPGFSSVQLSSVAQSCPTLCDPMDCGMPGLPVHHQLSEYTQTQVHQVSDAIKTSHPLLSPSLPAFSLSQISVFSNESVLPIKVLWFQLQHEPFQ